MGGGGPGRPVPLPRSENLTPASMNDEDVDICVAWEQARELLQGMQKIDSLQERAELEIGVQHCLAERKTATHPLT